MTVLWDSSAWRHHGDTRGRFTCCQGAAYEVPRFAGPQTPVWAVKPTAHAGPAAGTGD